MGATEDADTEACVEGDDRDAPVVVPTKALALRSLDVSGNAIGDGGMRALAHNFEILPALTGLRMTFPAYATPPTCAIFSREVPILRKLADVT